MRVPALSLFTIVALCLLSAETNAENVDHFKIENPFANTVNIDNNMYSGSELVATVENRNNEKSTEHTVRAVGKVAKLLRLEHGTCSYELFIGRADIHIYESTKNSYCHYYKPSN